MDPKAGACHQCSRSSNTNSNMLSCKVFVALMFLGVALCVPSNLYSQQTYEEPIPYQYSYNVQDPYAGADFGHSEDSDGHNARGSFHVQLPDGRKQTVKTNGEYEADHQLGYVANVQYEGEASTARTTVPQSPSGPRSRTATSLPHPPLTIDPITYHRMLTFSVEDSLINCY
nr:uncharacterized protein LOC113819140 [Penaeus vannamei]